MKTLIARFALSATLALAAAGTAHGAAYTLVNLGAPLGGTASNPASINDLGWVAGSSNLPGNAAAHAVLWLHGLPFDLGTLGGPSSAVLWPVKNDRGLIAGVSQTANRDPLGETGWSCNAFLPASPNTCVGFVWQDGRMSPLPTLGGNNGFATGANDRGQVVGWAETTLHDPTCAAPQVLQFRAVVYGPRPGQIAPLPAFRGDPDAAATAINDQGQIVGVSGICGNSVGALSAKHAVLWQNGTVTDLGNLGGAGWNTPMAINEAGQIVGFADLPGDDNAQNPNFQAFLWTPERGMQNLQTLPGDALSEGLGINSQGVVVGESIAAGFASTRAFLWQNGRMTDLNTLIPAGSNLYLIDANDINDGGEIAGQAIDQTTGDIVSYVAIPVHQASSGAAAPGDEAAAGAEVPPVALPDHVRQMLLQRLGLGAWPAGAR